MADLKKMLIEAFASNPKVDVFHQTKDGQCFEDGHLSGQHAKEIGGKVTDTEEHKRTDYQSEIEEYELEQQLAAEEKTKTPAAPKEGDQE